MSLHGARSERSAPASGAESTGAEAGDENQDRGDRADDHREPRQRHEQPVGDDRQQDGDEQIDHEDPSFLASKFPRNGAVHARGGSSAWPSSTAWATATTGRLALRAVSRSSANASLSPTAWRSMRIPLARSITARRSSAPWSCSTSSASARRSAWRRTATSMAARTVSSLTGEAQASIPRSAAAVTNAA